MTMAGCGWRPPEFDHISITTDGAIDFDTSTGGAGGVARSAAKMLGAWCKPYMGITDPLLAEAYALRDGVLFARLRGFTHVIMEVDCMEMVDLWNSRHNSRSIVAPILVQIGELARDFSLFVVQHVNRSANVPGHLCAKRACTLHVTESWLDETPSFLVSSLMVDCPRNALV